jgi:hypothetical protein
VNKNNIKATISILLLFGFLILRITSLSYADSAEVLPKGVFSLGAEYKYYFKIDERYNPDGNVEDVAIDYNATLDSSIFSDLSLLEPFMPPGQIPNIGKSVVSFDYYYKITEFTFMYGVTDRLSVGIMIPYWWVKNEVKAKLDTSKATVGKSSIGTGFGMPLVPLAGGGPFGDAVPLVKEDVQDLLGKGLDVNNDGIIDISGFGYKRFETWSDSGVGDIDVEFRYQYLKTANWRLAFTGGVRIPTGQITDPDSLVDRPLGTGAYALLFRLNNDYTGIKNLVLNATVRYDLYLPAKETLRIPDDVNRPITTNKEEVDRNIGDVIELEASGKYDLFKGFSLSALYKFGFAQKDRVSGNRGFAYESLELETNYTEHVYIIGLSYSTIPLFLEKKFPFPLTASISYRNRFAGSNNALRSQYIGFGIQAFF